MRKIHNKKRNSIFLYEVLTRELTKAIIKKDNIKKNEVLSLLKEFFKKGTILSKELECYNGIMDSKGLEKHTIEKVLEEVKRMYFMLGAKEADKQHDALLKQMNKKMTPDVFATFVPNYKSLATIYQIFNSKKLPVKQRIMLEENLIKELCLDEKEDKKEKIQEPLTKLEFKMFVKNFNEQYGGLLKEQKELLEKYILSSIDDLEYKIFVNDEIGRLKENVKKSLTLKEINDNVNMKNKMNEVMGVLETFKEKPFDNIMLEQVLKIQNLSEEIEKLNEKEGYKHWTIEELDNFPIGTKLVDNSPDRRVIVKDNPKSWQDAKKQWHYAVEKDSELDYIEWYTSKYVFNMFQSQYEWAVVK